MEALIDCRTLDDIAVLDAVGQLDLHTAPKLKTAIEDAIARGYSRLVVNLTKASYLDSTALAVLSTAFEELRRRGGHLTLVFSQPQVNRLFTISGLSEVFPIFPTETEALDAMRLSKAVPSV